MFLFFKIQYLDHFLLSSYNNFFLRSVMRIQMHIISFTLIESSMFTKVFLNINSYSSYGLQC